MARYKDQLFAEEKKRHPFIYVILGLLLLCLIGGALLNMIANQSPGLDTETVTINQLNSNFRILQISDLHGQEFGVSQNSLAKSWKDKSYNCVCITGDMFGEDQSLRPFSDLLDTLSDHVPILYVPGDEDPEPITAAVHGNDTAYADWLYTLQNKKENFVYLDAPYKVESNGVSIWFCPESATSLDIDVLENTLKTRMDTLNAQEETDEVRAQKAAVTYQQDRVQRIRAARTEMSANDVYIVLTHHPLQSSMYSINNPPRVRGLNVQQYNINLILSGHYNAGQVRLPGIGALYVPETSGLGNNGWQPDDRYVQGLSTVLGITQYISPGLGVSNVYPAWLQLRLFNPPKVTQLLLTPNLTK